METLKQGNITDFISYLIEQVNNHSVYVWGGQGQTYPKITEKWIREREAKQGESAATKAVNYWKKQCALGYEKVLHAYDCSGLGTYYMFNLEHLISSDTTAEGLRGLCEEVDEAKKGYFVFKQKRDGSIAARHIGYMVSDTELVHAAGEGNGIIRIKYKKSDWWKIGKPKMFSFDDPKPEPTPTPTPTPDPSAYVFTRILKKGCNGDDVVELKKLLIDHGYSKGITIDTAASKHFGSSTKSIVKSYQKDHGLKVDGIAGQETITSLGGVFKKA